MKEFLKGWWADLKLTSGKAHVAVSYALAAMMYTVFNQPHYSWSGWFVPWIIGFCVSMLAGVFKELMDWVDGRGFSRYDIASDLLGNVLFFITVMLGLLFIA